MLPPPSEALSPESQKGWLCALLKSLCPQSFPSRVDSSLGTRTRRSRGLAVLALRTGSVQASCAFSVLDDLNPSASSREFLEVRQRIECNLGRNDAPLLD